MRSKRRWRGSKREKERTPEVPGEHVTRSRSVTEGVRHLEEAGEGEWREEVGERKGKRKQVECQERPEFWDKTRREARDAARRDELRRLGREGLKS
jgi:hypothetical protein